MLDTFAGGSLAEYVFYVRWGETTSVLITESGPYRCVEAQLDAEWNTAVGRVLGPLFFRSSTLQRKETFRCGPPPKYGFE
jgi:hypothetical protein